MIYISGIIVSGIIQLAVHCCCVVIIAVLSIEVAMAMCLQA